MIPKVIGIAGGTASGKTTLSTALVDRLGPGSVLRITHDRYYRSIPADFRGREDEYNFDHPDALETSLMVHHLQSILQGESVVIPKYDFTTHKRMADGDLVGAAPIILIEGILVFSDPLLRAMMQTTFYVECPPDVRLVRRIRRDVAERGRGIQDVLDQYERTVRPMHLSFVEPTRGSADYVLDGTMPTNLLVDQVCSHLRAVDLVG